MLGPGKTLGLLFGGKILFDVALWALNGVSLGQAFLATTKVLEVDALVTSSS
jgi:hypothetical protein